MKTIKAIFTLTFLLIASQVIAVNQPMKHHNDERIKSVVYKKNDVVPIQASYKYVTHIDLGQENQIIDVIIGNSESWVIEKTGTGDGVLLKPLTYDDPTNLTLITSKRNYYFDLSRSKSEKNFGYVFVYPEDEFKRKQNELSQKRRTDVNFNLGIDKPAPEDWNFSYVLAGSNESAPNKIFDDGNFMYLHFGKKPIPAIFAVDENRNESVVNFHRSGNYIVIQGMYQQLTMRQGTSEACAFNKSFDLSDESESLAYETGE